MSVYSQRLNSITKSRQAVTKIIVSCYSTFIVGARVASACGTHCVGQLKVKLQNVKNPQKSQKKP